MLAAGEEIEVIETAAVVLAILILVGAPLLGSLLPDEPEDESW